jgi:hypothetical protein
MTEVLTMVASVLAAQVTGLAPLALRLRWQAVRDERRQNTLNTLTSHLPTTGVVEIHDVRDDGSHLRVRISTQENDVRP